MDNTPQSQNPRRLAPFSLRLTSEERAELDALAGEAPLGRFIKDAILRHGKRPPRAAALEDRKLLAKILGALGQSRIASNINQLAKAANSGSLPVNAEVARALVEAAEAIQWMRGALIRGMGLKPHSKDEEDRDDS